MTTKYVPHRYSKGLQSHEEQIGNCMASPVLSIDSETSVSNAAQVMHSKNVGSLLVKKNDVYVGIITERDMTRKVVGLGLDAGKVKVAKVMSSPVYSMEGTQGVEQANKFMAKNKIRHLAVTEDGKIVGMLSVRDLVSYYANPRFR